MIELNLRWFGINNDMRASLNNLAVKIDKALDKNIVTVIDEKLDKVELEFDTLEEALYFIQVIIKKDRSLEVVNDKYNEIYGNKIIRELK